MSGVRGGVSGGRRVADGVAAIDSGAAQDANLGFCGWGGSDILGDCGICQDGGILEVGCAEAVYKQLVPHANEASHPMPGDPGLPVGGARVRPASHRVAPAGLDPEPPGLRPGNHCRPLRGWGGHLPQLPIPGEEQVVAEGRAHHTDSWFCCFSLKYRRSSITCVWRLRNSKPRSSQA